MAAQLPALLFVLFGGLLADRVDRRRILIVFHLFSALPATLLAFAVDAGMLNYALLIVFALSVSFLNAFIQPARDSMLNQVSSGSLQRSVTIVMGFSFFSQIIGYGIAGQADVVGPVPLLVTQGLIAGLGGIASLMLPRPDPLPVTARRGALIEIGDGLRMVFSSPRMAPVMVLMFAVGIFYSGSFMVVNPLVVRDVYGGGAADIALSFMMFMSGTVVMTAVLLAVGGIERQGLGLLAALVGGGMILLITLLELPFAGYLVCIGCWGVGAAVAMSLARSIIQESAPDEYRARAMSIFTLGMLGGTPIGSPLMGYICTVAGPLSAYVVAASGMFVTVWVVWMKSDIANVNRLDAVGMNKEQPVA